MPRSMPQPEARVWHEAMNLLARREHSASELRGKLRARDHESALIETVLRQLQEQGLQSDERFAETCTNSLMARGYGSLRVRHELRQKGVSEELASTCETRAHSDDLSRACEALRRRHPNSQRERQLRFLAQRGYPSEIAWRAAKENLSQDES